MSQERWNTRIVPQSPHARLLAAETLAAMEHWRDVAPERLAGELEAFFDAGWCVDALVRALHARPDGSPQAQVSTAKRTDLVRYLLNQWRHRGEPVAPPVQAGAGTGAVVSSSIEEERQEVRARVHKEWPRSVAPETWDQVTAAVQLLRGRMRWRPEQIGDNELRSAVAPFFAAGWSVDCLLHALETSGVTKQAAPFAPDPHKSLGEALQHRLGTWKNKRGLPKPPPKRVLSYAEWDERQAALGVYEVRERRQSASQVQLEAMQQAREADARRRARQVRDRLARLREGTKAERSLDALYEIGPRAERQRGSDAPETAGEGRHERLLEGVSYLAATDPALTRWLRSLVEVEPEDIGPEAAKVTRLRLRDSRMLASLAALEQHGAGGRELSETTLALAQYAAGAPDLEAGQEVSDLWRVLRGAIRAHDARAGSR